MEHRMLGRTGVSVSKLCLGAMSRILRGVEDSLRRLNTDWIDLYQIHRPDPNTDIDETLGALTDLVHEGKIRYFGHSTFPASEITAAIIGPRTMEHLASQLVAADLVLSDEVLDRIDQINPPGVTINRLDNGWTQPALEPAARRR